MNSIDFSEKVISELGKIGDFGEIYKEKTFSQVVENDNGNIEKCLSISEKGTSLRSFLNNAIYFSSTNFLSDERLLSNHKKLFEYIGGERDIFLYEKIFQNDFSFSDSFEAKINITKLCYDRLKKDVHGLVNAKIQFSRYSKDFSVANSIGSVVTSTTKGERFFIHLTIDLNAEKHTIFESVGYTFKDVCEEDVHKLIETVISKSKRLKDAKQGPTGMFPCIISAEAGGTLIHEAVGHGLEADLVDKSVSVYSGKLGEKVASELITVTDDGTRQNAWGSSLCDDEGSKTQRTVLIEKGVLKNYLYDNFYAMKHRQNSTGNGRRQSYLYKPYPRMTNTSIESGLSSPTDMIKSIDYGVLVKKMGGGQVNTLTGDFIFEILDGYVLEKGEISYPIKNCSIIGNGPQILKDIDSVGNDYGSSLGTCGKEGQGVPVGDGQPTIRIPNINIGGGAV